LVEFFSCLRKLFTFIELKSFLFSVIIRMMIIQSLPSFLGLSIENPYEFLGEFLAICFTIKLSAFTEDALSMCLFPFSLKKIAKHWFHSLVPNSITS
jgi:hypothetical protein